MTDAMRGVVALLSPGAMGSAVAARLSAAGFKVLTSLDGRSSNSRARAEAAGMIDAGDAELAAADFILSIVPPAQALPLGERLTPHIARVTRKPLYIDANAINPDSKKRLAGQLAGVGGAMVDGAIIGLPPVDAGRRTVLMLAGPDAQRAASLGVPGFPVEILDGPIGAASALKMCFGGINKGVTALASMILLAAERNGAADALRAEMRQSMPDLFDRFGSHIPNMFPKAYRWVAEMEEIAEFLDDIPGGKSAFQGFAEIYRRIAGDVAGERRDIAVLRRAVAPD